MTQQTVVREIKNGNVQKSIYVKPLFKERQELAFPKEIWEKFNGGRFCIQCSGCHGCR